MSLMICSWLGRRKSRPKMLPFLDPLALPMVPPLLWRMNESRAYLVDLFYTLSLFTDFHAVVGALGEYAYAILVLLL